MRAEVPFGKPLGDATLGRHLAWALAVGVAYWALASYSLSLPVKASGISYIWPADGLALATLLLAPPRTWPIYLLAVFGGNLVASTKPPGTAILYSLFNVSEPVLVATVIVRTLGLRPDLGRLRNAMAFIGAIVGTMAIAVLISNTFDWLIHRGDYWRTWSIWYVSDTLGMLLLAPLVVCFRSQWRIEWGEATTAQRFEAIALLAGAAAITYVTLGNPEAGRAILGFTPTPFLFPAALIFWSVLRFGMFFGMATLVVTTLQAFRYTSAGLGPLAAAHDGLPTALLSLQATLMVVLVLVLLSAARTVEWRRAMAENAVARRRLEFAIEASGTLAFETHTATSQVLWSGDLRHVLGMAPESLSTVGGWRHSLHPDDRGRVVRAHTALVRGDQPYLALEYRLRRPDGTDALVSVDAYAVPVPEHMDEQGRTRMNVLGILRNVTETRRAEDAKRRLEARLAQSQKLEAIGALAGGIAHDFNNILAAILGYAEMLEERTEAGSRQNKFARTIRAAGERGRALVAQALAFSRAPEAEKRPVDLRALMEEVAVTIGGSLPAGIRMRESMEGGPFVLVGSATHLHQLAMNLCTNAIHAMPNGGELAIGLEHVDNATERTLRGGVLGPGRYVRLWVRDQGTGIDAASLPRIFEPFYSTKALGKGTGLGLSIAHGVALSHGGAIDVETRDGGTCFFVYLPASSLGVPALESARDGLKRGHGEIVLVVDDEPALVELSQDLLAELGYEAVGFTSASRALGALLAAPERFAAVLTDEVMPELAGTQLTARLRASGWMRPILIASAHGGEGFEARAKEAGASRILRKPYRRAELATALAEELSSALAPG
jgi:signal transduction histidine kinase/CheY-like chemotaxis protein